MSTVNPLACRTDGRGFGGLLDVRRRGRRPGGLPATPPWTRRSRPGMYIAFAADEWNRDLAHLPTTGSCIPVPAPLFHHQHLVLLLYLYSPPHLFVTRGLNPDSANPVQCTVVCYLRESKPKCGVVVASAGLLACRDHQQVCMCVPRCALGHERLHGSCSMLALRPSPSVLPCFLVLLSRGSAGSCRQQRGLVVLTAAVCSACLPFKVCVCVHCWGAACGRPCTLPQSVYLNLAACLRPCICALQHICVLHCFGPFGVWTGGFAAPSVLVTCACGSTLKVLGMAYAKAKIVLRCCAWLQLALHCSSMHAEVVFLTLWQAMAHLHT